MVEKMEEAMAISCESSDLPPSYFSLQITHIHSHFSGSKITRTRLTRYHKQLDMNFKY